MRVLIFLTLLLPTIAFGQDSGFVPLVGIPYVDTTSQATTLGDYVNGLYWASISIAAVLAFLKITWAGIKYMMSEIVTDKQSAKSDIKGALLGLIIILAAVLILDTINPEIKKLEALDLVKLTGDVTQPVVEPAVTPVSGTHFCELSEATYCELCAVGDDALCLQACTSKEGQYNATFDTCAHNKSDPGVDMEELDPTLDDAIQGTTTALTGGNEQIDAAIAASGKEVLWQTGSYYSEEYHYTRRNYMQECLDEGGGSYEVFYGPGAEMFVCYAKETPASTPASPAETIKTVTVGTYQCNVTSEACIDAMGNSCGTTDSYDCTSAISSCTANGGTDYSDEGANIICTKTVTE